MNREPADHAKGGCGFGAFARIFYYLIRENPFNQCSSAFYLNNYANKIS